MKKIFHFKRRKPSFLWLAKWFLILLTIGCLEILPIPVTDSILIFVLLYRPLWFKRTIDTLYSHLEPEAVDEDDLSYFAKYKLSHPKHFKKVTIGDFSRGKLNMALAGIKAAGFFVVWHKFNLITKKAWLRAHTAMIGGNRPQPAGRVDFPISTVKATFASVDCPLFGDQFDLITESLRP